MTEVNNQGSPDAESTTEIEIIGRRLSRISDIDEKSLSSLRQDYPHLRFTLCSEDDTAEREPFVTFDHFDLHLLSAGNGCLGLTFDISNYRGVVIALREAW
ncbi:DUF6129 family protein [Vibrio sp. qd031]|uniref:DUF6129 family protein n=1 Tax=Vibrio sp. qd031 TaxID=1603038 RepID=UPI000A0F4EE5|nr:DUF6129 family protein [Vibrio sp. qd031]